MPKRKNKQSGFQDYHRGNGRRPDNFRKRKYELPGIQDLSKEQERVLRTCAKEDRHLIIGGPGTGKSVLALLRSRRHQTDNDDYIFLVYNHLLNDASRQLFGTKLESRTWIAWFIEIFEEITNECTPRCDPDNNGFQKIDWNNVENIIQNMPAGGNERRPFLVIDEGQDMPPEFYNSLLNLGFDRFFVLADQNQQITESNSSRIDLENGLVIDTHDVFELRHNYRNRYKVARLANAFFTGDPASPPPDLPDFSSGPIPTLYTYGPDRLVTVATRVLRLADRDPRKLIGIISPNNEVRNRYVNALRSAEVKLDNPAPAINTYHSRNRTEVAFDEGGILVINAQTCKGLEFDIVLLADIDEHFFRRDDPDATKRRFYVMVARAKEGVFMFMKRDGNKAIEQILPNDTSILQRKEL